MDGAKRTQFWCWIEKQQRCTKIVVKEKKQSSSVWNRENTDLWPRTQSSASKEKISIGLFFFFFLSKWFFFFFLRSLRWPAMDIFNIYKVWWKIKLHKHGAQSSAELNSIVKTVLCSRPGSGLSVHDLQLSATSTWALGWLKMLKGPIQPVFLQGQFPAYHVTLRVNRKEKD